MSIAAAVSGNRSRIGGQLKRVHQGEGRSRLKAAGNGLEGGLWRTMKVVSGGRTEGETR